MQVSPGRLWVSAVASIILLASGDASAADCLTSEGKTACGYHCVSGEGQVRCAQTPEGVCTVSSGVVACWDPPLVLRRVVPGGLPPARCVADYGQVACGYVCETSSDRASCTQTPFGACGESEGRLSCWDPPAEVMLAKHEKTPPAECVANSGKIACGYHCVAFDGAVQCARTPQGDCRIEQGKIVCWDPPLESLGAVYDPGTALACLEGVDGRACGYRCLATPSHSACGKNRDDSCRSAQDRIVCEPPR